MSISIYLSIYLSTYIRLLTSLTNHINYSDMNTINVSIFTCPVSCVCHFNSLLCLAVICLVIKDVLVSAKMRLDRLRATAIFFPAPSTVNDDH